MGEGVEIRDCRQAGAFSPCSKPRPTQLTRPPLARRPELHLLETVHGRHVFVVDGSQLFDVDEEAFSALAEAQDEAINANLTELGMRSGPPRIDDEPPGEVRVRALSLAIAQKCNLACGYCYAQEGHFGSAPKNMPLDVACESSIS